MILNIHQLIVVGLLSATAVMAQGPMVPPTKDTKPNKSLFLPRTTPTPTPTAVGHLAGHPRHHKSHPKHPPSGSHDHPGNKNRSLMSRASVTNQNDDDDNDGWDNDQNLDTGYHDHDHGHGHGGGGQPVQLVCPMAGFFCESTLIDYTLSITRSRDLVDSKTETEATTTPGNNRVRMGLANVLGGTSRGGGGGDQQASGYFVCPSGKTSPPVLIANCPQKSCSKDYCVGGGPANVPGKLESGAGLYCGKTILRGLGQDNEGGDHDRDRNSDGGGGGGGGGSGGGSSEYLRNNLYYFIGSNGVNLGPCPGRCINAGAGVSDYCES
ncbi:hypothetical protein BGZ83_002897 [Gryganskiella cystojenkinii]|nr:hypothetical protein BGZ83_002897 [Gryganskiella cystojenkinii]